MLGDARLRGEGVFAPPCRCPNHSLGNGVRAAWPPAKILVTPGFRETRVAKDESMVGGVAGRYASALFALAQEQKATDRVAQDLEAFKSTISSSPDLSRLVASPLFSAKDQTQALNAVMAKTGLSGIAANFIRLVAAKRRLFVLQDMIRAYGALNDAAKGVTRAQVTAAHPLSDAQIADLKGTLRDITKGKSVDVAVKVDPSIIGGLIVQLGSRMVDGSLRTKLNSIRSRMKEAG